MHPPLPPGEENPLLALFREAKRRGVLHALAVYGAVAWGAIATAPDLLSFLGLPAWGFFFLLGLLAVALPLVVYVSWSFDFSIHDAEDEAGGPEETAAPSPPPPADSGSPRRSRISWRRLTTLGVLPVGLAVVGIAVAVGWPAGDGPGARLMIRSGPSWSVDGGAFTAIPQQLRQPLEWLLDVRFVSGGEGIVPSVEAALEDARDADVRFLLTTEVLPHRDAPSLAVSVYELPSGVRVFHATGGGNRETLSEAAGRLALELAPVLAERGDLPLAVRPALLEGTGSPLALAHFSEGQRRFSSVDFNGAAQAFRRAISADSTFIHAYYHLAVVERWRWNHADGLRAVERARRRSEVPPNLARLLAAQRRYLLRDVEGALQAFADVTLHYPDMPEGWLGLGEALFHYGGFAGHRLDDARRPLERALEGDSLLAPVHHHLAELALLRGDTAAVRRSLRLMPPEHPVRPVVEIALALQHGSPAGQRAAWSSLRERDLRTLSLLVAHFSFDDDRRSMADSVARRLLAPSRPPEDRLRGAQYRLMTARDSSEWSAALDRWSELAGASPFDQWVVHGYQAGLPAPRAAEMLDWAERQRRAGRLPDFGLPLDHDLRRAFHALVHEAVLRGDSSRVQVLLGEIDAAPVPDPADPSPSVLPAALRARLALLAHDSATAIDELSAATSRTFEPYVTFYPMATFAPERHLLIRLARATGSAQVADRWAGSFWNSMSFGDLIYQSFASGLSPPRPAPHHSGQEEHDER